jgi:alkylresorcinol/alkylpyrone synthase
VPPPTIVSLSALAAAHPIGQSDAARLLARSLARHHDPLLVDRLCTRVGVERRHLATPAEWIFEHTGLTARTEAYRTATAELGERALRACLGGSEGAPPPTVLISVSCTGFSLPPLDAVVINRLRLASTTRRLPVSGLGCAGGAAGLRLAAEQVGREAGGSVAFLSVETPSLALNVDDPSRSNLIGTALFGDGAAAALVAPVAAGGLQIVASTSELIPRSEGVMSFSIADDGFRMALSPELPALVARHLPGVVTPMLAARGLARGDVEFVAIHPGGPRIIDGVAAALGLGAAHVEPSYAVLRRYGNLSSASVLFVLRHILDHAPPRPGAHGLVIAAGPGVSLEASLLRWSPDGS